MDQKIIREILIPDICSLYQVNLIIPIFILLSYTTIVDLSFQKNDISYTLQIVPRVVSYIQVIYKQRKM